MEKSFELRGAEFVKTHKLVNDKNGSRSSVHLFEVETVMMHENYVLL
jgi:hypothetical protein